MKLPCLSVAAIALSTATSVLAQPALEVRSPDGRNVVTLAIGEAGQPTYSVSRDGETILAPGPISLELDNDRIGYRLTVTGSDRRSADERYAVPFGKAAQGRDHYNELVVHLAESGMVARRMDVVLRAYDDGIALRTVLPVQAPTAAAVVRNEETVFAFAKPYKCWGFNVGKFGSSHEGEFDPVDTTRIREHNLYDVPLLCETGKAAFAITEADLLDFAGMYLTGRGDGSLGVRTRLSPSLDDPRIAVRTRIGSPIKTPWRVVMLADKAGQLLESTLVTSLATPSRITDTSWIKPGKTSWDWWNGPKIARVTKIGTNTETAKAFIDFAAEQGLQYAMIDEGWYMGAGGGGLVKPGVDVTRWADPIDLEGVVAYAKSKKVGIWLWANWKALDDQMEEALTLYEKLGIAGIKVDFMDRDDQWMVNWYAKLLAAAARHKLMVDLHGAYAPRGLARTYPNFVTQEGVLGAEYNKWSRRVTASHNVMLGYTRAMLGAADYTPGGFRNVSPAEFTPRNELPFVQTTRAHGLAMYVVFESPLASVADSPDTYAASPAGLEFIRQVPTTWDETRFLAGDVGEYVAIARRKGDSWYIGAMNADTARTVRLPLDFLGRQSAEAMMWTDGAAPDAVEVEKRRVSGGDTLELPLAATGGAVAILEMRK